jgi:hypothetical protein
MAKCVSRDSWNDPDPDLIIEDTQWWFEQEGAECVVKVTDGLRHKEGMTPFPRQTPLYDETNEVSLGYITDVKIHGKMEA